MGEIKGLHHVAYKVIPEHFQKIIDFYRDFLGLNVVRQGSTCIMLDLGNTILEIVQENGKTTDRYGCLDHIALLVNEEDVDKLCKKVSDAGYEVTMSPNNIVIDSTPAYPARICFFTGPCGEYVELFAER